MKQRARAVLALVAAAAGLVVGVAAVAWACVPSSHFWAEKDYGPGGSAARLEGTGFTGGRDMVEIRWGSADGALLATAPAPDFDVTVTVPSVADGIYVIYAVIPEVGTGSSLPSSRSWNRTPFEVSAADTRGAWGDGGWGQQPAVVTPAAPVAAATSPAVEAVPVPAVTPPTETEGAAPAPAPAPAAAGERTARRAAPPVAPPLAIAPAAPGVPAAPAEAPAVAPGTATADAWAGVEASGERATSPSPRFAAPARDRGPQLAVGALILAVGLVAVCGGFVLAAPGRRNVPARSGRSR